MTAKINQYHRELALSPEQTAYWAGIIDGEGCIGIYRSRKKSRNKGIRKRSYGPCHSQTFCSVLISMTNERIINDACSELGMRKSTLVSKTEQHKDVFRAIARGTQAKRIINFVLPYLRVKHLQAFILLILWNGQKPFGLTKEERIIRHSILQLAQYLNRTGKG